MVIERKNKAKLTPLVKDGLNTFLCKNPVKGDISCTADKTTHGYWNKDEDALTPGEIELGSGKGNDKNISFTSDEQKAFKEASQAFWVVQQYDPGAKPGSEGNPQGSYGTDWYGDNGISKSALKKGDRIYVSQPITNHHRLAYNLAVQATKLEIAKLYSAAKDVKVGDLSLQDIYKLDKAGLGQSSNRIFLYTSLNSKASDNK